MNYQHASLPRQNVTEQLKCNHIIRLYLHFKQINELLLLSLLKLYTYQLKR